MPSGIYKISFPQSNHFYIGSASFLDKRKRTHLSLLRDNLHYNTYMQNTYNKYKNPVFQIIELCDKYKLIEREQFYIDTLSPDLNICKVAGNSKGFKHSDETITKIKRISRERSKDNEWRKKVSKTWFKSGKRDLTEQQRDIFINNGKLNFKGKKHNEGTRLLMSLAAKNRDWANYNHLQKWNEAGVECTRKPIIQRDKEGNYINGFCSITEAMIQFNTKQSRHLILCCNGRKKSYKGFIWEFGEKEKTA